MKGFEETKLQEVQTPGSQSTSLAFEDADGADEEDAKDQIDSQTPEDLGLEDGEYSSSHLPDHRLHLGSLIPVWKSSKAVGGYRYFVGPDCSLL